MWALLTGNHLIMVPITMIQRVEDDSDVAMYSVRTVQKIDPRAKSQIELTYFKNSDYYYFSADY